MKTSVLTIRHIVFTGIQVEPVQLYFDSGLNLLYGASNTGKSFSLKAIDFMLGGKDLPDLPERIGYDQLWFGFSFKDIGDFTLSRSVNGGAYNLYAGHIDEHDASKLIQPLAPTQNTKNEKNLSHYLLEQLGFSNKRLAKNASGETEAISFRDIVDVSLVDEISIQSELSPIESGQYVSRTKERSIFRLLLTGQDDSAIVAIVDEKTFKTSKAVRIEVIEEMLQSVKDRLSLYPDIDDLPLQNERLSVSLDKMQSEFNLVQGSIRKLVNEKQYLSIQVPQIGQRIEEIQIHLERFRKLEEIYESDIERLTALEEAGFLMSLSEIKDCSLCGAPADVQKHINDISHIERVQKSAIVEILKIENQREDLKSTITDLISESSELTKNRPLLLQRLEEVEHEISLLAPTVNENIQTIKEIIKVRDHVKDGLSLLEQEQLLISKLDEFNRLKKPSKDDKPNLKAPESVTYQLCKIISAVLKAWGFPGNCDVNFDEKTYDLVIDGKLRVNNGKGVRAVTHAAFKVALLIFCREKGLPHPGFIVLDTPLLTYRDPLKNTRAGNLTEDEKIIAKSSLKTKFFSHLSSIKHLGQFIILENIDPPEGIELIANVQTFYGNEEGARNGLFPKKI